MGQSDVPEPAQSGVKAIAAGGQHSLALKNDDTVIAWGSNYSGQILVPAAAQGNVEGIAAGWDFTSLLVRSPGNFGSLKVGETREQTFFLHSLGDAPLINVSAVIEGQSADQFSISSAIPDSLAKDAQAPITLRFHPTRGGNCNATLRIQSNDPSGPFVLPLRGIGVLTATKSNVSGSTFTYAPLRLDRQTGLMLQKISFTNTTGVLLKGLRLVLSKVASGVQVYSSSAGETPGTLEVIYSNAIQPNETISFDLVYFDPKRRTAESMNPVITAEALLEPEADSLPLAGTVVPLRSARTTPQGPFLEWNSAPKATYAVEYSDDAGNTWFSAVHRLKTAGARMFWIDRGQPETKTKPVGLPNKAGGRFYRVKKL